MYLINTSGVKFRLLVVIKTLQVLIPDCLHLFSTPSVNSRLCSFIIPGVNSKTVCFDSTLYVFIQHHNTTCILYPKCQFQTGYVYLTLQVLIQTVCDYSTQQVLTSDYVFWVRMFKSIIVLYYIAGVRCGLCVFIRHPGR